MPTTLEVLLSPAEFDGLRQKRLSQTVCVVFDILRATTTMLTALANGADAIVPVGEITEALALRAGRPELLLAGERHGLRIRGEQTGGIDFDLGNSPREFVAEVVRGKTIVMTTTNGTRALRACAGAQATLIGSFLNLGAVAKALAAARPERLMLICAGTFEQVALEDTLAAGGLAELLWPIYGGGEVSDSAEIARQIYRDLGGDLLKGLRLARNGRRLMSQPDLADDVAFCAQRDSLNLIAAMQVDGTARLTTSVV